MGLGVTLFLRFVTRTPRHFYTLASHVRATGSVHTAFSTYNHRLCRSPGILPLPLPSATLRLVRISCRCTGRRGSCGLRCYTPLPFRRYVPAVPAGYLALCHTTALIVLPFIIPCNGRLPFRAGSRPCCADLRNKAYAWLRSPHYGVRRNMRYVTVALRWLPCGTLRAAGAC